MRVQIQLANSSLASVFSCRNVDDASFCHSYSTLLRLPMVSVQLFLSIGLSFGVLQETIDCLIINRIQCFLGLSWSPLSQVGPVLSQQPFLFVFLVFASGFRCCHVDFLCLLLEVAAFTILFNHRFSMHSIIVLLWCIVLQLVAVGDGGAVLRHQVRPGIASLSTWVRWRLWCGFLFQLRLVWLFVVWV